MYLGVALFSTDVVILTFESHEYPWVCVKYTIYLFVNITNLISNDCCSHCFLFVFLFGTSSKIFYWPFQGCTSFVDLSCFFCPVFAMPLCASVYMCLVVTCWERADLLSLVCGVLLWVCHFPTGILGQMLYLIVSIPDLCTLTYFFVQYLVSFLASQSSRWGRESWLLNFNCLLLSCGC